MTRKSIAALSFLISSCSSINCPVQNTVLVYYNVCQYDAHGELMADTLTDTLYVWSRRVDGTDTLLMNRGVNLQRFPLQISYQHPEDVLLFYVADTARNWTLDTVWIKKDDIPHFESVDCSAYFFHNLTAVRSTHQGIDTVLIDNSWVTFDQNANNINIIFKQK